MAKKKKSTLSSVPSTYGTATGTVTIGQPVGNSTNNQSSGRPSTMSRLTKDQRQRKAGKSRYFWKDRSGQWHYHVEGKTTTDRKVANPVNKGKQQEKASADYLANRIKKSGRAGQIAAGGVKKPVLKTTATARSAGGGQANTLASPSAVKEPTETPQMGAKTYGKAKGHHGLGAINSSANKPGVSAKMYDSAKSRLKKRMRKGY